MIKINLLIDREAIKRESMRNQIMLLVSIIVLLVTSLAICYFLLSHQVSKVQAEIRSIEDDLKRLEEIVGEVKDFESRKTGLEEKLRVIETLSSQRSGPAEILDVVSRIVPEKLWMTSMRQEGSTLAFEGNALDEKTVATFMTALENSSLFDNVELQFTKHVQKHGLGLKGYSITCTLTQITVE